MSAAEVDPQFETLLEFLRDSRGFDFTGYKRASLMRRVHKRMQTVNIGDFGSYMDHLEVHPDEFDHLFNTILINVTSFFRDEAAWQYLAGEILPDFLAAKGDAPIRVWSAGCATGEEAYSLAIVLAEALGTEAFRERVKIYATDIDEEELLIARQGAYTPSSLEAVPNEWRETYFEQLGTRYTFRNDLRRAVIFGRHNLVKDAPISHLDLLACRNTLMYFNREVQSRVLSRFHFALDGEGILFLGKAETMLSHSDLFRPISIKHRIFAKVPKAHLRDRLLILAQAGNEETGRRIAQEVRMCETAFDVSPEAQIVVDVKGRLMLANGRARMLFDLHDENIGSLLQDLKFLYQPTDLRSPIDRVLTGGIALELDEIALPAKDGVRYLKVQVVPLVNSGGRLLGASVIFQDVTHCRQLQLELEHANAEANAERETAYEELQATNEELETTNEELQSTNEELETTNEELQSTNEELETMNEEMQSANEELETMNDELHRRTLEIHRINSFLESILMSLRQGVVVLDQNNAIHVWSNWAETLWGLRAEEVQGQSIFNLDIGLPVERLRGPIRACLTGETKVEELRLEAVNRRGRRIECRVTCLALSNLENGLRGVILLMEEWRDLED